ncbi:MAG: 3-oxoadipate enol-lactonase [Spirochaetes bacterium]|nr:3-oxoadipate enol-lactonase [Spirochaetota bacterium]
MAPLHSHRPKIHYVLEGPDKAPVLLFSHSLASSTVMWEPQVKHFHRSFRCLRFDTRGHGESEAPEGPYTFQLLADDVLALLDSLEIDKVHFVGLSMGGMIGQELALRHPDRLLSLTLSDTSARTPPEASKVWEQRIQQVKQEGLKPLLEGTMERWFTDSFRKARPALYEKIEAQFLKTPVAGYIGCVQAIMKLDNLDRLPSIRTPTLILVGEEDPGTPVSVAEEIHRRIKGSKLAVIPHSRHLPNVEQAEKWNKELETFLESVT